MHRSIALPNRGEAITAWSYQPPASPNVDVNANVNAPANARTGAAPGAP